MAKKTSEQEIEDLLQKYFETWEQLLYYEELVEEATGRWMAAKAMLFEKRSREHCEAVMNLLQQRAAESGEDKYRILAQDVKFWIEADPGRKELRQV